MHTTQDQFDNCVNSVVELSPAGFQQNIRDIQNRALFSDIHQTILVKDCCTDSTLKSLGNGQKKEVEKCSALSDN